MRVYYNRHGRVTGYSRWNQPRSFLARFWYVVFGAALLGWPIAVIPGWYRWLAEAAWLAVCGAVFLLSTRGPGHHATSEPTQNNSPGPRDWTPAGK